MCDISGVTLDNIGGVTFDDVVRFQVKLMMGGQYDRVIKATKEEDIIVACLRVAWNDAFRHVTKNRSDDQIKSVLSYKKKTLDDYICEDILGQENFLEVFINYAKAENSEDKAKVIQYAINKGFLKNFEQIKIIEGDNKQLCFGHIQKLFNMALKFYLCLYFCSSFLGIEECFCHEIKRDYLDKADCPIDSIILKEIGESSDVKWSKITEAEKYSEIQGKINKKIKKNESNLYYDFKYWNSQHEKDKQ